MSSFQRKLARAIARENRKGEKKSPLERLIEELIKEMPEIDSVEVYVKLPGPGWDKVTPPTRKEDDDLEE